MNIEEVKRLLEAFYNGETSLSEEQLLMLYFTQEEVPEELREEKDYFAQLATLEPAHIPSTLAPRIDEVFDKIEKTRPARRRMWLAITSVAAAAIAVILTINFSINDTVRNEMWVKAESQPSDSQFFAHSTDTVYALTPESLSTMPYTVIEVVPADSVKAKPKARVKVPIVERELTPEEKENNNIKVAEALMLIAHSLDHGMSRFEEASDAIGKTTDTFKSIR